MKIHGLLSELYRGTWLIEERFAQGYYPVLYNLLQGKSLIDAEITSTNATDGTLRATISKLQAPYLVDDQEHIYSEEEAIPSSVNTCLVIPIQGAIMKYDYCGSLGTNSYCNYIKQANSNPGTIKKIVLKIDSGGGSMHGTLDLVEAIRDSKIEIHAYIDGLAASAAYWIASACSSITVNNRIAVLGSIGAYTTVTNMIGYYREHGLDIRNIYAPQSTDKNAWSRELEEKGTTKLLEKDLEDACAFFITSVKELRPTADESAFTGKTYYANEAITLGLADKIGSLEELCAIASPQPENTETMSLFGKKKENADTDPAEQVLAERNALQEIVGNATMLFGDKAKNEGFDLVASISALQTQNKLLIEKHDKQQEEISALGSKAAQHPIIATRKVATDKVEDEEETPDQVIANLAHNKAIDNNPLFN